MARSVKIYGNRNSGSSRKVEYVAKLLGTAYDWQEMDFQKDLKTEAYLKVHPAGKIPAIDDDGLVLFESGAIGKYLCDRHGDTPLYPKGLAERATVEQWIDFISLHVGTAVGKVVYAKVFGPRMGQPVDEAAIADGMKLLDRFLPIVDAQLGKHAFVASGELTLADVTLFATLFYAEQAALDLSAHPRIVAWHAKLAAMDAFK